jgi:hypothetical protein
MAWLMKQTNGGDGRIGRIPTIDSKEIANFDYDSS